MRPFPTIAARAAALALAALVIAAGPRAPASPAASSDQAPTANVPQALLDAAQADPSGRLDVIILGDGKKKSTSLADNVTHTLGAAGAASRGALKTFASVPAVAGALSGRDIVKLARQKGIVSITPDAPVAAMSANPQKWDDATGAAWFWNSSGYAGLTPPTIAIVDSGVDTSSGIFGNRLIKQVDFGGGQANGDDRGHGTFVAGLAAGDGPYAGVAPKAKLVSLDVFDSTGAGRTSDVIRAADWILANKDRYGIKVANFSLQTAMQSTFMYDPLDRAVERLWMNGVVVVCAAGNYAVDGQPSGVLYAPGNDPFVLTVGAADVNGTSNPWDDTNAPWSAYGYTPDGFAKPELGAPGRYMIGQVSANASLKSDFPGKVRLDDRMMLSGTSFASPIVAGMAANLLAVHPDWTPDQVKGALMLSATTTPWAAPGSLGVGEANLESAFAVATPPNPNLALDQFIRKDWRGDPVFDSTRWRRAARADASWNSASWSSASWSSASWSSASWSSASWSSASWSSASWSSASWSSASWSSSAYQDSAGADGDGEG